MFGISLISGWAGPGVRVIIAPSRRQVFSPPKAERKFWGFYKRQSENPWLQNAFLGVCCLGRLGEAALKKSKNPQKIFKNLQNFTRIWLFFLATHVRISQRPTGAVMRNSYIIVCALIVWIGRCKWSLVPRLDTTNMKNTSCFGDAFPGFEPFVLVLRFREQVFWIRIEILRQLHLGVFSWRARQAWVFEEIRCSR